MPNWCSNCVHMYGPEKTIQDLINKTTTEANGLYEYHFELLAPIPKNILEEEQRENWLKQNWKVTRLPINVSRIGNSFYFDSAWAPPEELFLNISKLYPELTFELFCAEPGCLFTGYLELNNGKFIIEDWPDWDSEEGLTYRLEVGELCCHFCGELTNSIDQLHKCIFCGNYNCKNCLTHDIYGICPSCINELIPELYAGLLTISEVISALGLNLEYAKNALEKLNTPIREVLVMGLITKGFTDTPLLELHSETWNYLDSLRQEKLNKRSAYV